MYEYMEFKLNLQINNINLTKILYTRVKQIFTQKQNFVTYIIILFLHLVYISFIFFIFSPYCPHFCTLYHYIIIFFIPLIKLQTGNRYCNCQYYHLNKYKFKWNKNCFLKLLSYALVINHSSTYTVCVKLVRLKL